MRRGDKVTALKIVEYGRARNAILASDILIEIGDGFRDNLSHASVTHWIIESFSGPPTKCFAKLRTAARVTHAFALSNDVGGQLIFDVGDAVAELQFSLFKALNLDKVGTG
jgi:hypothetical protein